MFTTSSGQLIRNSLLALLLGARVLSFSVLIVEDRIIKERADSLLNSRVRLSWPNVSSVSCFWNISTSSVYASILIMLRAQAVQQLRPSSIYDIYTHPHTHTHTHSQDPATGDGTSRRRRRGAMMVMMMTLFLACSCAIPAGPHSGASSAPF